MTFRYIGSKARVTDTIRSVVAENLVRGSRFVDGFAGTGAVAASVADLGVPLIVNDTMHAAITMALARLVSVDEARFHNLGGYAAAIDHLNQLASIEGYMHRAYSPASKRHAPVERRYFTEHNAGRIDAMRRQIAQWAATGVTSQTEDILLLGDLICAVNRAANIAGTYGCFLSNWQNSALDPVVIRGRDLLDRTVEVAGVVGDVHDLEIRPDDVVYYDPPYTKRQYASYYHILETLVVNDEPVVEGVSGLRPWRNKASVFCYKRKALSALVELITGTRAGTVLLSYSCEGHVDLEELDDLLKVSGNVSVMPIDRIGRYRPNVTASGNGDAVTEYLVRYEKKSSPARVGDEVGKQPQKEMA